MPVPSILHPHFIFPRTLHRIPSILHKKLFKSTQITSMFREYWIYISSMFHPYSIDSPFIMILHPNTIIFHLCSTIFLPYSFQITSMLLPHPTHILVHYPTVFHPYSFHVRIFVHITSYFFLLPPISRPYYIQIPSTCHSYSTHIPSVYFPYSIYIPSILHAYSIHIPLSLHHILAILHHSASIFFRITFQYSLHVLSLG